MEMFNMTLKSDLRTRIKETLYNLSQETRNNNDIIIRQRLMALTTFQDAQKIGCYISTSQEVDTTKLIREVINRRGIIFVPFLNEEMQFTPLFHDSVLEANRYGIMEPVVKENFQKPLNCIIVPGLAFDVEANRLGRGGGHYDKYLQRTHTTKIALCYDFQIIEGLPIDDHDVPMDIIVTEKRVIVRKNFEDTPGGEQSQQL
jgi:5-formyltetrahydrofolate cyclo-ligase